jgi:hypothetical protein
MVSMKFIALTLVAATALAVVPGTAFAQRDELRRFEGGGGGSDRGGGGGGGGGGNVDRGGGGGGGGEPRILRQRDNDGPRLRTNDGPGPRVRNDDDGNRRVLRNRDNDDNLRRVDRDDDRRRVVRDRDRDDKLDRADRHRGDDRRKWKRWRPGLGYSVIVLPAYSYGAGIGWCHFHRYPANGMRFHRNVQCHVHAKWRHPSIAYVAVY